MRIARRPASLSCIAFTVVVFCLVGVPALLDRGSEYETWRRESSSRMTSTQHTASRVQQAGGHTGREERRQPWSIAMQSAGTSGGPVTLSVGRFSAVVQRENERVFKVRLSEQGAASGSVAPVTWKGAIDSLQREQDFRSLVHDVISGAPWEAEFWETPPISSSTLGRPFEFVLVDAPGLRGLRPDPEPFREKLDEGPAGSLATSFENLGGDAMLVVPQCAVGHRARGRGERGRGSTSCEGWRAAEGAPYAHLADFMRGAPAEQVHEFLSLVGKEVERRVAGNGRRLLWVSTSGLGVSWLHVRLDSRPKYYTYGPYKNDDAAR